MTTLIAVVALILGILLLGICGLLSTRIEQTEKEIEQLKKDLDKERKLRVVGK